MIESDLYLIDPQKMHLPKAYGFALRCQIATSPSVVYISQSDEAAHRDWVKSILCARSYILRQERPDLFAMVKTLERSEQQAATLRRAHTVRRQAEMSRAKSLRRSHTTRHTSHTAPLIPEESLDVQFQKGSLLDGIGRNIKP